MDQFNEPLNEIIFEKRNKSYGAYVLRKEYTDSLKFGVLISYAFVATIVILGVLSSNTQILPPKLDVENFVEKIFEIDNSHLEKPKEALKPEQPKPKEHVVIPLKNDQPTQAADEVIEQKDQPEKPAENPDPGPVENSGGTETGTESKGGEGPVETESNTPTLAPDEAPDMEGGVMKYLKKNLRYPDRAVENKTSGTVYLSFVVEKDGSVNDIKVLKAVGDGCEEEAIRVVKKMKWNPGKAKGHPVRVQFTLPVKFVITP